MHRIFRVSYAFMWLSFLRKLIFHQYSNSESMHVHSKLKNGQLENRTRRWVEDLNFSQSFVSYIVHWILLNFKTVVFIIRHLSKTGSRLEKLKILETFSHNNDVNRIANKKPIPHQITLLSSIPNNGPFQSWKWSKTKEAASIIIVLFLRHVSPNSSLYTRPQTLHYKANTKKTFLEHF